MNHSLQRGEPQLGRVFLHAGHFVHAGLFHRGLYQVRVGCAGMGHVRLRLEAGVHRVAHEDEFLRFLELVADLRGFRLIEVVSVRPDAVRDVGQEVQEAPVAAAACHACVCRGIPPAQHKRHSQRSEQFHYVQRLVLDHHLVGHARRHDDGEQGGECHAHLQDPPERALCTGKRGVGQKLVGLKDDIIYFLFQKVYAEIR